MSDIQPGAEAGNNTGGAAAGGGVADQKTGGEGGGEWHAGFDPETKGYLTNRGWDKLTPAQAALEASKAHREAEKFLGVGADKLLRIADPTNEAEYRAMWGRLGAPNDATKYDFSDVKVGDKPLDPALASALAKGFDDGHVPLSAAKTVAAAFAKYEADRQASAQVETQAVLDENKAALAKNWGPNADANMFVAKSAAQKLGVSPEAVAALEGKIGYPAVMEMFRKIGEQMGEARFVTNQVPGGPTGVYTRDQATARVAELKADSEWVKLYLDGGAAEKREMLGLQRIITGEDETTYAAA